MKCPNCQFQNPESAKFCVECGNKFEVLCPVCGFGNSPSFKFCAECGENLSRHPDSPTRQSTFDEKLRKTQRNLPQGLTEKILFQRERIEGECKQVTVLFSDMAEFTPLAPT